MALATDKQREAILRWDRRFPPEVLIVLTISEASAVLQGLISKEPRTAILRSVRSGGFGGRTEKLYKQQRIDKGMARSYQKKACDKYGVSTVVTVRHGEATTPSPRGHNPSPWSQTGENE